MALLAHTVKSRLYDPPLARLFLALTTSIAIVVCVLQGAALHTSREGVAVLRKIVNAANQAQVMAQQDQAAASSSSVFGGEEISIVNGATYFIGEGIKNWEDRQLVVTAACAEALRQPIIYIGRMHTMAFTFLFYEAWTFALSVVGLISESRPHLVAVLVAHALACIYAISQITQTQHFHTVFHVEISEGACAGSIPVIPEFWDQTRSFQLGVTLTQGIALPLVAFLAYKLADHLKWTTFHKMGADRCTGRAHTLRHVFEIALLLDGFFVVASQCIWLHEIFSYPWSTTTRFSSPRLLGEIYRGFLIVFTVLLATLLVVGGLAVRQQRKSLLLVFLAGNTAFLAHTLFLTTQRVYMTTLSAFRFLTFLSAVAVLSTSATLIIGVFCLFHLESGHRQKQSTVDWVGTALRSDLSSVDSRLQGANLDAEKALRVADTTECGYPISLLHESHQKRETLLITLPEKITRRVASVANSGSYPSNSYFQTSSSDSPARTTHSSLSRTPSTSTRSSGSFSLRPSPTRSRPRPLLRINTKCAAQASHKSLKGLSAFNPDFVVLLEGGNLGTGFSGEAISVSVNGQQRVEEKSQWSMSTKGGTGGAVRGGRRREERAAAASHWSISTKAATTEGCSPSVADFNHRG